MIEFWQMGPNDDMRSLAIRLAHYGVLGGFLGLAIVVVVLALNIYLIFAFSIFRSEVRRRLREMRTLWNDRRE